MKVPELPPCAISDYGIYATCLLFGAFGVLIELAIVGAIMGLEYVMSIREGRLRALHPHRSRRTP